MKKWNTFVTAASLFGGAASVVLYWLIKTYGLDETVSIYSDHAWIFTMEGLLCGMMMGTPVRKLKRGAKSGEKGFLWMTLAIATVTLAVWFGFYLFPIFASEQMMEAKGLSQLWSLLFLMLLAMQVIVAGNGIRMLTKERRNKEK